MRWSNSSALNQSLAHMGDVQSERRTGAEETRRYTAVSRERPPYRGNKNEALRAWLRFLVNWQAVVSDVKRAALHEAAHIFDLRFFYRTAASGLKLLCTFCKSSCKIPCRYRCVVKIAVSQYAPQVFEIPSLAQVRHCWAKSMRQRVRSYCGRSLLVCCALRSTEAR